MASQKERESGILQIEQKEDVASQKEKKGRLRHRKRKKGQKCRCFVPLRAKTVDLASSKDRDADIASLKEQIYVRLAI